MRTRACRSLGERFKMPRIMAIPEGRTLQATRLGAVRRAGEPIAEEVRIMTGETAGILADETAGQRVIVVASAIIVQSRDRLVGHPREADAVAPGRIGF